ncbi:MAG: ribosome biogenesis GTPase Der [Burkholderiaceae bacterium]
MKRTPVIALVGRPNVGKSTLFNRLTRSRAALVADVPGLTRDRHYGTGWIDERSFIVIDTGGFEPVAKTGIAVQMARQARQAVIEADCVIFLCDARAGLTTHDETIAAELRRTARRLILAVNKAEGMPREQVLAEFHEIGLPDPVAVSSAHGDGVSELIREALALIDADLAAEARAAAVSDRTADGDPASAGEAGGDGDGGDEDGDGGGDGGDGGDGEADAPDEGPRRLRVAVVGRPNAGKSTLINTLLGEERLIAFDQPGTTRDAVAIDFERQGRPYTLVDTAGVRRRGKVSDMIEKFSVVKTLQAIEDSNVCVLMLDATQDVADQDANIAGFILEAGRALVIVVNKWDAVDEARREAVKLDLDRKLYFLRFARMHFISALQGKGVNAVMRSVDAAFAAATRKLSTPKLTRMLQQAVERQAPPRRGMFRPKMRYAHQGGQNPPIVVIHGNALDAISDTYRRYLEGWFREQFKLEGTPLRIEFRSTTNPYAPGR